ncbi:MAG: NADPH:quinone oxidoreductase family protein [Acidimicrobiia bacterium]|nr:NADPH:quinone oxidoreductase family protein [Acidimicrobiia bacterium]MDH5291255.1 NADPH:quinone oxidoreductase family protein [Acidimicrobiia bacterium]
MRAWQLPELGDPWDNLRLVELPSPEPGPGQARIVVEGGDLNFADILQCRGSYQVRIPTPFVPGMGGAGRVVAAGPGTTLRPGERVVGATAGGPWGIYAEEALVNEADVELLAEGVSGITAAGAHVTYGTAWFALHQRGRIQPGESVLVLAGAGGVGSAAIQMAKAHGCWVLAAAGGPAKVEVCRTLGADVAIDYAGDDLYQAVMDATSGRGVDVVYDPVGGAHFDVARRLLAWEGRLLVVGFASGTIPSAPANHTLVKNYSIVGVHMGGYRSRDLATVRRCYAEVYRMLADGEITPLVSEIVALDDLPRALRDLAGRRTTGRVVLDPTAGPGAGAGA